VCTAAAKNIPNTGSQPAPTNPHQVASFRDASARCSPIVAVTVLHPPSCPMPMTPTAANPTSTTVQ